MNFKTKLHLLAAVSVLGFATTVAKPASAATVYCGMQAPQGNYTAYLFRTGDRYPTRIVYNIYCGGGYKQIGFSGISAGAWFIRVVNTYDNYAQQTNQGYLSSYYSWPLSEGTLNMYE